MKTRLAASALAVVGGAMALLVPGTSQAGNVGYYDMSCGGNQAAHAAAITAAGHTPVAVTTPDAGTLSGLDALSVTNCSNGAFGASYTGNLAAITAAVNGGMVLIVHDRFVTGAGSVLPGGSGLSTVREFELGGADIDFPAGSPIISGPGGILTNTSLDGGTSSSHGFVTAASLPAGGSLLAIRPTGGAGEGSFTTCAAEGYTGTQLTWCRNICEIEQTPASLKTWIRRWMDRFHYDPPCAGGSAPSAKEGATIQYPYGEGRVIYSTIPLDHYLGGNGTNPPRDNFNMVYLPNVIGWALPAPQEE
ncbi:MAG: hypothetical protein EOP93_06660 [Lysobacteraceae bacterium]|nr:MAG: hypothetical protein EOP93_06660 [Xanthomonadaceae bacterium]